MASAVFPTPDEPRVVLIGDGLADAAAALSADRGVVTALVTGEPSPEDLLVAGEVPDCIVAETPATAESTRSVLDRSVLVYADLPDDEAAELLDRDGTDYVPAAADTDGCHLLAARIRSTTEAQRRETELSVRAAAMDQAGVGITVADADHPDEILLYANEGFEATTGYPPSAAVGRNCRFLQGPDTDPDTVAEIRAGIEADEPVSVELLNYRADGEPFWNQLDITPVEDDDGDVSYYFGFQKDVTERVELRERLERENERLSTFASVVSHDLRNPLAVAQAGVETAMASDPTSEAAGDLARVDDALDRMESLIEDLLALARQGSVVDEPEPTSLATVASGAWSTVDAPAATLTLGDDLGVILADPERLRTVFENLFRNAVEHGSTSSRTESDDAVQHGDAEVAIHVGATPDGFYVEDDGPGIPADRREQVFDQGFTTADSGTGIGLAVVESIATAHGWTAVVEAGADGGARFAFLGVDAA